MKSHFFSGMKYGSYLGKILIAKRIFMLQTLQTLLLAISWPKIFSIGLTLNYKKIEENRSTTTKIHKNFRIDYAIFVHNFQFVFLGRRVFFTNIITMSLLWIHVRFRES